MHQRSSSPSSLVCWFFASLAVAAIAGTTTSTLIDAQDGMIHRGWLITGGSTSVVFLVVTLVTAARLLRRRDAAYRARLASTKERERRWRTSLAEEKRRNDRWHSAELADAIARARMNDDTYRLPPPIVHTRTDESSVAALKRDFMMDTSELARYQ